MGGRAKVQLPASSTDCIVLIRFEVGNLWNVHARISAGFILKLFAQLE